VRHGAALPLAALALLASGCGSRQPDPYAQANVALLDRLPVYPGASSPRTTASGTSNTEFGARDWTLPAGTSERAVVDWYVRELRRRGWTISGESFGTIRAVRGEAALSVGARGRTLEATANARSR
jgi:hypothetical protein